jgi:mannose-6-phosphate isomerase
MIERKPWGGELRFALNDSYCGKILEIKKGHRLSKQFHREKHETIYLQSGRMILHLKTGKKLMRPGDYHDIPPMTVHRFEAKEDCTVFEVSTNQIDDVVRLEDDYGRA